MFQSGISNEPQEVPASEPMPFCSGALRDTHPFLTGSSTAFHVLGRDFLQEHHAGICFSEKEDR